MRFLLRVLTLLVLMVHGAGAVAEPIGPPPSLVAMVQAPGGYPRVPSEPFLVLVESLAKEEVRALSRAGRQDATVQLARLLWMDGDNVSPIRMLEDAVQAGVPVAQYLLGTYLRFGNGDRSRSLKLLQEAARQGHAVAQETLAGYHERGTNGVERDEEAVFRLYLAAGKQGLRHSQFNVGMLLCKGLGVTMDKATGRAWFVNSQQDQRMPFPPRAAGCDEPTAAPPPRL